MKNQYVVFNLCGEEYGVDIQNVQEITEYKDPISVPNAPNFIEGIINLRGNVTPIVSLKKRFNLVEQKKVNEDRIIIINIREKLVGFMVDDVSQVLTLDEKQIENPPEIIIQNTHQYITRIGKIDKKIILILNLVKVLTEVEKNKIVELEL